MDRSSANSECSGTRDWTKITDFSGSSPAASQSNTMSSTLAAMPAVSS